MWGRGVKEREQVVVGATRGDKRAGRGEEVQEEAEGDVRQDWGGEAHKEDNKGGDRASDQAVAKGQRQVTGEKTRATKVSPSPAIERRRQKQLKLFQRTLLQGDQALLGKGVAWGLKGDLCAGRGRGGGVRRVGRGDTAGERAPGAENEEQHGEQGD